MTSPPYFMIYCQIRCIRGDLPPEIRSNCVESSQKIKNNGVGAAFIPGWIATLPPVGRFLLRHTCESRLQSVG